jgi:hypothetical protein
MNNFKDDALFECIGKMVLVPLPVEKLCYVYILGVPIWEANLECFQGWILWQTRLDPLVQNLSDCLMYAEFHTPWYIPLPPVYLHALLFVKKSLKILNWQSETVYRRRFGNTLAKTKRTNNDLWNTTLVQKLPVSNHLFCITICYT